MKGDTRKVKRAMAKMMPMNNKGQGNAVTNTIITIVLLFVLFLIGTMLAKTQGSIRDTLTAGTAEYDVANESLVGMADALGDNASSVYLIAIVVLIIILVMGIVFVVSRIRGG